MSKDIQRLHFGPWVEIEALQGFLEQNGIKSYVRDQFNESVHAGFVDGLPNNVDLYVPMEQLDDAMVILKDFLSES